MCEREREGGGRGGRERERERGERERNSMRDEPNDLHTETNVLKHDKRRQVEHRTRFDASFLIKLHNNHQFCFVARFKMPQSSSEGFYMISKKAYNISTGTIIWQVWHCLQEVLYAACSSPSLRYGNAQNG